MTFAAELDVSGRRVTVIGGAADSLGKISSLLQVGAVVTVVSTEVAATVRDLAVRGLISWLPREAEAADFVEAALVIAATGNSHTDAEVRLAATEQNRMTLRPGPVDGPSTSSGNVDRIEGPRDEPMPRPRPVEDLRPEPVEGPRTQPRDGPSTSSGKVILVGGGPGDPGLLTIAGLAAIRTADVIICDRLAPHAALAQVKAGAEVIDVGKIPRGAFTSQERINRLLIEHASRGRRVVRFKGGDSFVFGRGGEEWQACAEAGIGVDVIPGVTSAVAGPALAGIPVTHRQLTQGFTVVSGHLPPGDPGSTLDWVALARTNTTLVVMMGVATLAAITRELIANGLSPATPATTVADAGLPSQQTVRGMVSTIAALTRGAQIKPPAITVIGAVAGFDPNGGAALTTDDTW